MRLLPLLLALSMPAPQALAADAGPAEAGAVRDASQCFERKVRKRKTSFGVHQWTAEQRSEWCVRRGRIVSVRRRAYYRTGTNWRHVSHGGWTDGDGGAAAVSQTRFHFRLRYPHFEQNCHPRLTLEMHADGSSKRRIQTGC